MVHSKHNAITDWLAINLAQDIVMLNANEICCNTAQSIKQAISLTEHSDKPVLPHLDKSTKLRLISVHMW